MQSSAVGENVISDLRVILEDALERIKSEIFGPGHPDHPDHSDQPGQPGQPGHPAQGPADSPAEGSGAPDTKQD